MEYFDNILCVTYKELLDIMPKGTLNSQLSREKLDVVSRGGDDQPGPGLLGRVRPLCRLSGRDRYGGLQDPPD